MGVLVFALQTDISLADGGPQTLEEARARHGALQRQQLEAEAEIDDINAEDEEISDAFNAATILVERQQALVEDARRNLNLAHDIFEKATAEVEASEERLAEHRKMAKEVAVAGYLAIQGDRDRILLSSSDLNQGVKKRAILDIISTNVGDFRSELRLIEDENLAAKEVADQALMDVISKEAALNAGLKVLEADKVRLAALRVELEKRRQALQELVDQYERENRELERLIAELETSAVVTDTTFVWPSDGPLGGGFGQRFHPILRIWRAHNGIDLGGASGQSVRAAHGGRVFAAAFERGFGNYIILDRGDGITTIYAHLSRRLVEEGQAVTKGLEIGKLGSTGLSTGPHLHFEVRLGGTPVNPIDYLPFR